MPPPLTLAYLLRERLILRTWCSVCATGGADLDPAPLVERYGAAMTLDTVTARRHCRRCGKREAEIWVAVKDLRTGLPAPP